MNPAYRLQKHADAVADTNALLQQVLRELATVRGDVSRLVDALPRGTSSETEGALDDLVQAAFTAMGDITWVTAELMARTLLSDAAAHDLERAIVATGKSTTRSLGKYLSTRIPGAAYLTCTGLEIRRITPDGNSNAWTISRV
ncbi:MAG: hypothetical protein Q7U28_06660 [Aquabacterium sp.]|nr:hypothetical protein [Aquabacterium sp.]